MIAEPVQQYLPNVLDPLAFVVVFGFVFIFLFWKLLACVAWAAAVPETHPFLPLLWVPPSRPRASESLRSGAALSQETPPFTGVLLSLVWRVQLSSIITYRTCVPGMASTGMFAWHLTQGRATVCQSAFSAETVLRPSLSLARQHVEASIEVWKRGWELCSR